MPTSRVVRGMSNHVTSRCSASGLCRFTPKDGEAPEVPLGEEGMMMRILGAVRIQGPE